MSASVPDRPHGEAERIAIGQMELACPFAGLLPPLPADKLADLEEDIRQTGIQVEVIRPREHP